MSKKQHILGLNTAFESLQYDGFNEDSFNASISLLDYDAVVIDTGFICSNYSQSYSGPVQNKRLLSENASSQIVSDYTIIREQIIDMLKNGRNIFLLMGNNENCFIYTGEKQYSGTGKNTRQTNVIKEFDAYSFLPINVSATHIYGKEIDYCGKQPYNDFFRKTSECYQYSAYFSIKDSFALAKIKGSEKVVSTVTNYEKGKIICLPQPYYEDDYTDIKCWEKYGTIYLDNLFELNERLNFSNDFVLPNWAYTFSILSENDDIAKLNKIEYKIKKLEKDLKSQQACIARIQKYKAIVTSSGEALEEITKQILSEMGFSICESEKGRSDIIAKYDNIDIVAEIKGVSKSAAEKHAAQLEKWVSQFIEENDKHPKALLIVNGYYDCPIHERQQSIFPDQMLKYCIARGHVLISTIQLLCLFIDIKNTPACAHDRIIELLTTEGVYNKYSNIGNYLVSNDISENINI